MFTFECVQTGLVTAGGMQIYVYSYGNILSLIEVHNAWFALSIMCGVIASTVESFFAWRIYQLSRSRILASIIIVLALAQLVASVVSGVLEREARIAADMQGASKNAATVWLSCAAAADVLIALSMVILLLRIKSGIASTDALIDRLVRMVVETGALTAGISILVIVLAFCGSLHKTLVYETPALILTKLYSNTFLTNLNSRNYVRNHDQHVLELSRLGSRRSAPASPLEFGGRSVLLPSAVTANDTENSDTAEPK
ncbi:hypothetical protein WOLCODRAFT_146265 [Wolfiporia cocos MD-104 SS10]|uniref:DUF6534 domain-containing protein n=1 Tax=Wolfiporia cocos (strain MD-104) TaxID=742152 RepID=A0A2H3J399_WOLCO|nr:hypothetical protein WOLCODRAFT_146265 [Wolfiporia cocos MD-104 SS10]